MAELSVFGLLQVLVDSLFPKSVAICPRFAHGGAKHRAVWTRLKCCSMHRLPKSSASIRLQIILNIKGIMSALVTKKWKKKNPLNVQV